MSANKPKYFRQLSIMSNEGALVLGLLEMGLDEQACRMVGIHTSKRGMTILLNRQKLCSGKTVRECVQRFEAMQKEARGEKV